MEWLEKQPWYIILAFGAVGGIIVGQIVLPKLMKKSTAKGDSYASMSNPVNEIYDGEVDDTGESYGFDKIGSDMKQGYPDITSQTGDAYGDSYGDSYADFDTDHVAYMLN